MYVEINVNDVVYFVRPEVLAKTRLGDLSKESGRMGLTTVSDFIVQDNQVLKSKVSAVDLVRVYLES